MAAASSMKSGRKTERGGGRGRSGEDQAAVASPASKLSTAKDLAPRSKGLRLLALDKSFQGNVEHVIRSMREGVNANAIPQFAARFGLTQEKFLELLRLPKSTLKARIKNGDTLSPLEQDRLYRADKVWHRALSVLEDTAAVQNWIVRQNRALGGEMPFALLDTEAGYELVLDTLGRIEYGVIA